MHEMSVVCLVIWFFYFIPSTLLLLWMAVLLGLIASENEIQHSLPPSLPPHPKATNLTYKMRDTIKGIMYL